MKPTTNVTPEVESLIKDVTSNKQFIVLMTDKNLGPAIIKREKYIRAVVTKHLLYNQTYRQLSKHEAAERYSKCIIDVKTVIQEFVDNITQREL